MVVRKSLPPSADTGSSPPYPINRRASSGDPSAQVPSSHGWEDGGNAWTEQQHNERPQDGPRAIPELLRVGPRAARLDTGPNPYLQEGSLAGMQNAQESSANAWGGSSEWLPPPSHAPPPPPAPGVTAPPIQQFANLSVSGPSTNPWQPALDEKASLRKPTPTPSIDTADLGNDAWSRNTAAIAAPTTHDKNLIDLEEPESPAWDEGDSSCTDDEQPVNNPHKNHLPLEPDNTTWHDNDLHGERLGAIGVDQHVASGDPAQQEDWNLIDHEPAIDGQQQSGVVAADGTVLEQHRDHGHPEAPQRTSHEKSGPDLAPRQITASASTDPPSLATPDAAAAGKHKKETYEIKKISWHDVTAAKNPRVSPILVQNANGPCPLLALVNALTLSTPSDVETALVETLRSREQVSLGLLLDAVFDELMSGRRGGAAQKLPDVSDLYSFLITLHTGMNVNPRFFPASPSRSAADFQNSTSYVDGDSAIPGTFEDTREMKLYSTFSVPLIHGWLPSQESPEYAALKRLAPSYEDAQNIMFHEEVLEEKLFRDGLSFEEQATLEDISTIKAFFNTAATQLTPHGLQIINTSLAPGSIAILFRNDHFSTLYRHPHTLQLLQLVTDMGYAGHEEVVWESLVDVNGENAEFLSGDFRRVGGNPTFKSQSHSQNAVESRNQPDNGPSRTSHHNIDQQTPKSPQTEQEDHDLALALQLQDEEEERERNEIARRRRETELSQQYIEQQGSQGYSDHVSTRGGGQGHNHHSGGAVHGAVGRRPTIPSRRNGPVVETPSVPPADPEAGTDAPPPSYEHASTQAPYVPPVDHPSHPNANPSGQRRTSAHSSNNRTMGSSPESGNSRTSMRPTATSFDQMNQGTAGNGRRRTLLPPQVVVPPTMAQQRRERERDKDCAIM